MKKDTPEKEKTAEQKKILIIDDEPETVKELIEHLESAGYKVTLALSGNEGLRKLREAPADLIILDLMLPEMNGYKVARFIKFDKRFRNIPLVMFSARSDKLGEEPAKEVGVDAWFTKPFKPQEMFPALEKLLGKITVERGVKK
ncbi:MAG: response regulator [Candidatus Omnitrophica bacterium]|nr:response regulator [Candidatus Omnitrophota bacterium]